MTDNDHADERSQCRQPTRPEKFIQLMAMGAPHIAERWVTSEKCVIQPIVALGLDASGVIWPLVMDFSGRVHPAGDDCESVRCRARYIERPAPRLTSGARPSPNPGKPPEEAS